MEPSKDTPRDTLHPAQEDGVRQVGTAAGGATEATQAAPDAVKPGADQTVAPPESTKDAEKAGRPGASAADRAPRSTRASAAWAATVAALMLLVVLIVFVLQNPTQVVLHFLWWSGSLAVGMAMLIAAVAGGLVVATTGVARLTQLRVRARRTRADL